LSRCDLTAGYATEEEEHVIKSTMKVTAAALACGAVMAGWAFAADRATKDEAQAMVKDHQERRPVHGS
jgi:hypothetical protein